MSELAFVEKGPLADAVANPYIQLVALDVDGTLVRDNSDDSPTENFLNAVREATAQGIAICLNGARGYNKMVSTIHKPLVDSSVDLGLVRYGSYANGALIYDYAVDAFVVKNTISHDIAESVTDYLRQAGVFHWVHELRDGKESVDFAFIGKPGSAVRKQGDYGIPKNRWIANSPHNDYIPVAYDPLEPLVIVADGLSAGTYHTLTGLIEEHGDHEVKSVVYRFNEAKNTYQVFVLNSKANKGHALRALTKLYGVSLAGCAVFGDGGNDKDMFTESVSGGGLAFAMGNAAPDLKAFATHILPAQTKDGATTGLRFILNNYSRPN